jgi:peptide deformylase
MIYTIVKYGDPILEKPAEPITEFDAKLQQLVNDMWETMYEAHGVGLAAPQIGISKRLTVVDCSFKEDPEAKYVLINPEVISTEGKQTGSEGCLSLPDIRADVTRAMKCTVRAQDARGKTFEVTGEELLSRCLQHEIDHLNGKLFISRISALKRDLLLRKIRKLQKEGNW